jgi:hypothetical protein
VPMVIDRLNQLYRRRESYDKWWRAEDPTFVEVVQRNFWFTSIEDPSAFRNLDIIGDDRVMLEVDYPHSDSSWPDTQELVRSQLEPLEPQAVRRICYETAAELYHHPLPSDEMFEAATYPHARPVPTSTAS